METRNEVAFITGGTNGVGRAVAVEFAKKGFNVAVGYSNNDKASVDTVGVLNEIHPAGVHTAIKADITTDDGRETIRQALERGTQHTQLSHAVLAASGGLEQGKDHATYPHLINVDAQVNMVRMLAPKLMQASSTLTFVESHQAYYLGKTKQSPNGDQKAIAPWDAINSLYRPIAESKHEGMLQILAMQGDFSSRLLIASTDIIPDTRVMKLAAMDLKRKNRAQFDSVDAALAHILTTRRAELDELGLDSTLFTTTEFAAAIVAKATEPSWNKFAKVLLPDHLKEMAGEAE
ncbi:SDR family NAD(P)-dependent oxidoreductase [Candidatus Uhrbacteria bacterium]|nr:SDR family NAD(P)-dependent oxidoreductase [Candidatus Uhrbacteria bacterium]